MEWPGKLSTEQIDILVREMHSDIKEIKQAVQLVPSTRKEVKFHRWLISGLWVALTAVFTKGFGG